MTMSRRMFARTGAAAAAGSLVTERMWSEAAKNAASPATKAGDGSTLYHFAVIADTHIIDEFYIPGSENGVEDNTTILQTTDHLKVARGVVNNATFAGGKKIEQ